jgi:hypothetical protein
MRRAIAVFGAVLVVSGGISAVSPAQAAPVCRVIVNRPATTVSVAGDEVATVPSQYLEVCVDQQGDITQSVPVPRLQIYTCCCDLVPCIPEDGALFLEGGDGSSGVIVTVRYSVGGPVQTLTVPVGAGGGSDTCIAFWGDRGYNPGGCLVEVEDQS